MKARALKNAQEAYDSHQAKVSSSVMINSENCSKSRTRCRCVGLVLLVVNDKENPIIILWVSLMGSKAEFPICNITPPTILSGIGFRRWWGKMHECCRLT